MNILDLSIETGIIQTISGKQFNLFEPTPEMIDIRDIATGLANKGHFSGLTPSYFSIAQHCVMVCDEFSFWDFSIDPKLKLLALLHDAAEAYIGDMIKPLKVHIPQYAEIEENIMKAICAKYSLDFSSLHLIKSTDLFIQEVEYSAFYNQGRITYMNPQQAKLEFLDRFKVYYDEQ
ncbi:MAG TPA: hypothetical protein DHV48_05100, partial [Prolixibacteraceae bacterium]|nr:hypothetical protein [Prolixibacteraceae bacterium]